MMNKNKIIETLKNAGLSHNLWENYGKTRVYLNLNDFAKLIKFSYNLYKTGNISSATLNSEDISNREGSEIYKELKDLQLYIDLKNESCSIVSKSIIHGGLTDWQEEVVEKLEKILMED